MITCPRCGRPSFGSYCRFCAGLLPRNSEEAYGLGKAKAKKEPAPTSVAGAIKLARASLAPAAVVKKKMPEWAWALIAIGSIALVGGGVYYFVSRAGRK